MSESAAVETPAPEAPAAPEVVLGPGAREAVDGDVSKSEIPESVDPQATAVVETTVDTSTPEGGAGAAPTTSAPAVPEAAGTLPAGGTA